MMCYTGFTLALAEGHWWHETLRTVHCRHLRGACYRQAGPEGDSSQGWRLYGFTTSGVGVLLRLACVWI